MEGKEVDNFNYGARNIKSKLRKQQKKDFFFFFLNIFGEERNADLVLRSRIKCQITNVPHVMLLVLAKLTSVTVVRI